jgi:hypothetical protein
MQFLSEAERRGEPANRSEAVSGARKLHCGQRSAAIIKKWEENDEQLA